MSVRFCILGTGSSGNCALLESQHSRVLIDAGFSTRRLSTLLEEAGTELSKIDAIFLTHEHGDHAAALSGLKKHPHIKIFANQATARAVQDGLKHTPAWQLFETGSRFAFQDLSIDAFSVPHDARDPVGFRFTCQSKSANNDPTALPLEETHEVSLVWLTDLGYAPAHLHEHVRACDALIIEANHCPELLRADTKRPWSTKQRIAGRHGHLSNPAVAELLQQIASPRWRHIFLTHLSRDCNSPAAIEQSMAPLRSSLRCEFNIVQQDTTTRFINL